jgi:hypothetical protein
MDLVGHQVAESVAPMVLQQSVHHMDQDGHQEVVSVAPMVLQQ